MLIINDNDNIDDDDDGNGDGQPVLYNLFTYSKI